MQVHLETEIAAPADKAWAVLGSDFAGIDRWSSVVKTSRPIGHDEVPSSVTVARSAPVPGRETKTKVTLTEVLTKFDDDRRSLTFVGTGLPPIVRRAENTQSIVETGPGSSKVVFEVEFDFKGPFGVLGPIMAKRMSSTFGAVQEDLKKYLETTQ